MSRPEALREWADAQPPVRLAAAVFAGLCLAFLAEWGAHALAPTTTERAVVTISSVDRGVGSRDSDDDTIAARLDSGRWVDLAARNALGVRGEARTGLPVLVTRSTLDGQVLSLRTPSVVVDTHDYVGAWIKRSLAVLLGAAALWLALRRAEPLVIAALAATTVAFGAYLWSGSELADGYDPPSGMRIYDEPRLAAVRIVAVGQPARAGAETFTVTGPPAAGLPPGADPGLAGFATITVPLRTDAPARRYVRMELIGDGAGYAELLRGDTPCGGAPGAYPSDVPAGAAAGPLCAVVPTGFVPRYLVIGTAGPDQVAVALR